MYLGAYEDESGNQVSITSENIGQAKSNIKSMYSREFNGSSVVHLENMIIPNDQWQDIASLFLKFVPEAEILLYNSRWKVGKINKKVRELKD